MMSGATRQTSGTTRRWLRGSGVLAVVLVTLPALADDKAAPAPPPVTTPPISYASLPQGHFSSTPPEAKRPAAIPAGSKTNGVWVVRPVNEGMPANYFRAVVAPTAAAAKAAKEGGMVEAGEQSGCVTTGQLASMLKIDGGSWGSNAEQVSTLTWQSTPRASARRRFAEHRVQAVHVEQFTQTGEGRATVDFVDAWVDPVTGGSRSIGNGSVPMMRVATGPAGLEVYAARDEGKVDLIVRTGKPPKDDSGFFASVGRQLMAVGQPSAFGRGSSDCGAIHVELPTGDHATAMAQILTQALLPPLHPVEDVDESDSNAVMRKRASVMPRRRPLVTSLSSTQSTADPQPVVTVAFGWSGPDEGG